MSGMAEVLAAHRYRGGSDPRACRCGHVLPSALDHDGNLSDLVAAHQSDMLTAAGFGPVKEAAPPEVRYVDTVSEKNVLDEVVARDAYAHLEAMDDNHWWLLVTAGGQSVHVNFYTKRAKISGHAEVEEAPTPRVAAVRAEQ